MKIIIKNMVNSRDKKTEFSKSKVEKLYCQFHQINNQITFVRREKLKIFRNNVDSINVLALC